MNNIGVLVPHLGSSQISYYAIKELNNIKGRDKVVFFEQLTPSLLHVDCATICINKLGSFRGTLITTNIDNTILAYNIVNKKKVKICFYVWDLEWLRQYKHDYIRNLPAYIRSNILIARGKVHADAINNYCNRYPYIVEHFDLNRILEITDNA